MPSISGSQGSKNGKTGQSLHRPAQDYGVLPLFAEDYEFSV